jgi:hypothetical protein
MQTNAYSWETIFETSEETMTHIFSDRVKVICDFRFEIITLFRDNTPIDKFSFAENGMTISEYERFLLGIARTAEVAKDSSDFVSTQKPGLRMNK